MLLIMKCLKELYKQPQINEGARKVIKGYEEAMTYENDLLDTGNTRCNSIMFLGQDGCVKTQISMDI